MVRILPAPAQKRIGPFLFGLPLLWVLALSGCAVDYPQTTVFPRSDLGQEIQNLYEFVFWAAVVIFILVEGLLLYSIFRFRARRDDQHLPPQVHGNTRLEVAWTLAPALVVMVMLVLTFQTIAKVESDPPEDALQVRVVGHQWWWHIEYPEYNIRTANEIHLPVGRPVAFSLESKDVIHSFWVPRLMGKMDLIPGHTNRLWFTPQETGLYLGQCAEYCGTAHAQMRLRVIVQTEQEFAAWVQAQQTAPPAMAGEAARGLEVFRTTGGCLACHTVQGVSQGVIGPDLTHVGSRTSIAAGILENTPENLARWLRDPQAVKPGNKMKIPQLSEPDIQALVAFLNALK
jgi:cytochrome c oxidase subunit 2